MTNTGKPLDQRHREGPGAALIRNTFCSVGAKLGTGWLLLLVFTAVFAPLLANSRPLLGSYNGVLQSPALAYLSALDITLIVAFVLTVAVWRTRLPYKVVIVLCVAALTWGISQVLVNVPKLSVYEEHREQPALSMTDWEVLAPIPYSAKDYLRDYGDTGLQAPGFYDGRAHYLGTTENGADLLSRMIHATRLALGIGLLATGIALFIGVLIGGVMGYFAGIIDMLCMRVIEIFEAIPTLFLLLTFVAFFDRSLYVMMVIIGLTSWPGYARYVRAEFLRLRQQEFVQAAVASGLPLGSILFRHILPNAVAPVLVAASFGVASAILAEATLSFLGLGLVDDPSWGQMLNQAVRSSTFNWWMALFPGGAIFLTVFSYNLIGEALRDALDPLSRSSNAKKVDTAVGAS